MIYQATMFSPQPKTTLYKFGYYLDQKNIAWKSDAIHNANDFRHKTSATLMDPDANKFNNIVIWVDLNNQGGIGPMIGDVGKTFAEIHIMAQENSGVTNKPPTVSFKSSTLVSAIASMPPPAELSSGNMKPGQILSFNFEKVTASWLDD
jgi:hypothetical protein